MARIKKVFIVGFLLLCIALQCLSFAACGGAGNSGDGEGVEPLGLYTDLQFSLHGENGQVQASVKNKFTLLPSTVTVNIELYRSDSFKESVADMTLAASNYIYDLDQGKTITATASTDGKQSYWKARAYYKVDNKPWQETFSETVLFTADGIKTTVSAPVPEDKDYYISDFLQPDAERVEINIHLPPLHPEGLWMSRVYVYFDNEEQMNTAKDIFGEIKLDPFDDMNILTPQEQLSFLGIHIGLNMSIHYEDGSYVFIRINDNLKDKIGANLFVRYVYIENGNEILKNFTALISDEARDALTELANDAFYDEFGKAENN